MTMRSISKRRQAFAKLRDAETLLRNIVEHSTNLFYVHSADHVLTYVSPQSRRFFDCEPEEALVRWTEFITDHPVNLAAVANTQRAIDTGERQPSYLVECISRTGRKIWVEVNEAPIVENGKTVAVVGSLTDITERRQAEEELRRSEERYRRLYNETPVMLHSIDHEGRLVSVSNYWLDSLGYQRSEVLGRRTTEFLSAGYRRYAERVVLPEFFRTGFCKDVPYRFVKKNGETLDVLLSAIAERDDAGKVVRSLAVMIDVTERKRAEREIVKLNEDLAARAVELEKVNSELEAFCYSVSHDLRTPLTVINGYSEIIQELCGQRMSAACQGYLQEISAGTRRLSELIDALLEFSSVTRKTLQRQTVDLSEMARQIAAELAFTAPERRTEFRVAGGIVASADAKLLRIALGNLLGNAWKYTARRTEAVIEFGVAEVGGTTSYYVRDNGAGFDMAHAEQLFTPFMRLPGAERFAGYGIGLGTVERIIRRHGGRIWAESTPDQGATFWFTIPPVRPPGSEPC